MRHSGLFIASTVICVAATLQAQIGSIAAGFTRIFNGRDLSGWHISRSNHHGTTGEWRIEKGVLVAAQRPLGQGGILLTDRSTKTSSCISK